jgi:hypothetical protein
MPDALHCADQYSLSRVNCVMRKRFSPDQKSDVPELQHIRGRPFFPRTFVSVSTEAGWSQECSLFRLNFFPTHSLDNILPVSDW